VDPEAAARWLAEAGADALIHGHTHRPGAHALQGGRTRHVLGDWDFDHGTPRAMALRLDASGLHALDLATADAGDQP
jgi:UDP-2,3-diacylglucosamine hydrolase